MLEFEFMQRAFVAAVGLGLVCGVLGFFVVLRRLAFIGVGEEPLASFVQALSGSILVAPPVLVLALGAIPPSGTLSATLPIGPLPAGVEALEFFGQSAYLDPSGAIVLGAASAVLLLDDSF